MPKNPWNLEWSKLPLQEKSWDNFSWREKLTELLKRWLIENNEDPTRLIDRIVDIYENTWVIATNDGAIIMQILEKNDPETVALTNNHAGLARIISILYKERPSHEIVNEYIQHIDLPITESAIVLTRRLVLYIMHRIWLYTTTLTDIDIDIKEALSSITPWSEIFQDILQEFHWSIKNTIPAISLWEKKLLASDNTDWHETGSVFDILQLVIWQRYWYPGNTDYFTGTLLSMQWISTATKLPDTDLSNILWEHSTTYSAMFDKIPLEVYIAPWASVQAIESKIWIDIPEEQQSVSLAYIEKIQWIMLEEKPLNLIFMEAWLFAKQYWDTFWSLELWISIAFRLIEEVGTLSLAHLSNDNSDTEPLINLLFNFKDFKKSISLWDIGESRARWFEDLVMLLTWPQGSNATMTEFKYRIGCKVTNKTFDPAAMQEEEISWDDYFTIEEITTFYELGLFARHSSFLDFRENLSPEDGVSLPNWINSLIADLIQQWTVTLDEIVTHPYEILFPVWSSEYALLENYFNIYWITSYDISSIFWNFVKISNIPKKNVYPREIVPIEYNWLSQIAKDTLEQSMLWWEWTVLHDFQDLNEFIGCQQVAYILVILQQNGLTQDFRFVHDHLNEYEQIAYPFFSQFIQNIWFINTVVQANIQFMHEEQEQEDFSNKIYKLLIKKITKSKSKEYLQKIDVILDSRTSLVKYIISAYETPQNYNEFISYLVSTTYEERVVWIAFIYGPEIYDQQTQENFAMRLYTWEKLFLNSVEEVLEIPSWKLSVLWLDTTSVPYNIGNMKFLDKQIDILLKEAELESIQFSSTSSQEFIRNNFLDIWIDSKYIIVNPEYLIHVSHLLYQASQEVNQIFPQVKKELSTFDAQDIFQYFEKAWITPQTIISNTVALKVFRELLPKEYHIISMYPELVATIQQRSLSYQSLQTLVSIIFEEGNTQVVEEHLAFLEYIHELQVQDTYITTIEGKAYTFTPTDKNINNIKWRLLHMYLSKTYSDINKRSRIIRQVMEFGVCGQDNSKTKNILFTKWVSYPIIVTWDIIEKNIKLYLSMLWLSEENIIKLPPENTTIKLDQKTKGRVSLEVDSPWIEVSSRVDIENRYMKVINIRLLQNIENRLRSYQIIWSMVDTCLKNNINKIEMWCEKTWNSGEYHGYYVRPIIGIFEAQEDREEVKIALQDWYNTERASENFNTNLMQWIQRILIDYENNTPSHETIERSILSRLYALRWWREFRKKYGIAYSWVLTVNSDHESYKRFQAYKKSKKHIESRK